MNLISITKENLATEHICCAISSDRDCQVASKKAWLSARLDDGLVFLKGDVRGKCFIEYIPAEHAWAPVDAPGYLYIDCLWVSGQFKGKGYSNQLLAACIADARDKGKRGLAVLSSQKKQAFLSDPQYLAYKGFRVADTAEPSYTLLYLPFDEAAPKPQFRPQARAPHIDRPGFVLYYTRQCPFTAKYVPVVAQLAKEHGAPFETIELTSAAQAQAAPAPFTAYSLFYNGALVTHEIQSEKKFCALLAKEGF